MIEKGKRGAELPLDPVWATCMLLNSLESIL